MPSLLIDTRAEESISRSDVASSFDKKIHSSSKEDQQFMTTIVIIYVEK